MFDLGTRAFEGIRNASRMDDDDDEYHEGGGGSGGGGGRGFGNSSGHGGTSGTAQQPAVSGRHLDGIQEGGGGDAAIGWGAGGAGLGLLSLRARPPRMFGPLGEMDPFTWESAVAQAVLRAGMRDEGDLPSER